MVTFGAETEVGIRSVFIFRSNDRVGAGRPDGRWGIGEASIDDGWSKDWLV